MSERYTSPETSRLLAEAGLEQDAHEGAWWCEAGCSIAPHVVSRRASGEGPRALDLTDILHELTRPRLEEADARPLTTYFSLFTSYVLTRYRDDGLPAGRYAPPWNLEGYCCGVEMQPTKKPAMAASPVEAAAACLIALLRERAK